MAFGSIVLGTDTYNQTGNGRYTHSTVVPNGPTNGWIFSPGKKTSAGTIDSAATRVFEKDVVVNGVTKRSKTTVTLQIKQGEGATVTELDVAIGNISDFLTPAILTRLQLGES